MAELKRFSGYQAVQSTVREQLPVGGYVAKIIGVKMQDTQYGTQRMSFQVEIDEGEYKGFYRRDYDAQKGGIINGDGDHKPIGLLHDTLGAETGVTAASSTAITADEILDLQHSLRSGYRRKAVWIMNDSTVKLLRKLKDGNGNFLWQPGLQYGTPDTLLNQKVLSSSYMPLPVAGNKAIMYGDFDNYFLADREGRSMQRLNELYAKTDQVGFKITERIDGRLILPESVKVLKMKE